MVSHPHHTWAPNSHADTAVAALRHPHIITDVWGPGWRGYNRDLTLSVNVQRRARRIEQLERSKAAYEKQKRHDARKRAKEAKRRAKWAKWTFGLVDLVVPEETQLGPWQAPDWELEYEEGCGPVKWEAVWTISYVPTLGSEGSSWELTMFSATSSSSTTST